MFYLSMLVAVALDQVSLNLIFQIVRKHLDFPAKIFNNNKKGKNLIFLNVCALLKSNLIQSILHFPSVIKISLPQTIQMNRSLNQRF